MEDTPGKTEVDTNLEIRRGFNELVSMVTKGRTEDGYFANTPKEIAEKMKNLGATPEKVSELIFENPPIVYQKDPNSENGTYRALHPGKFTILPPSETEMKASETQVSNPSKDNEAIFSTAIKSIRNFLKAPRIKDGFSNNEERVDWEAGIIEVCKFLDETLSENDTKREYVRTFKEKFNYNKYTKNQRSHPYEALTMLLGDDKNGRALIQMTEMQREVLKQHKYDFRELSILPTSMKEVYGKTQEAVVLSGEILKTFSENNPNL